MNKSNYIQFKDKVGATTKTYFTIYDLKKFYGNKKSSLKPLLSRWKKQGFIIALGRGYYTFDLARLDYMTLACEMVRPSYISFEYALNYHGFIDQVPFTITLATTKRHQYRDIKIATFEYTTIQKRLFFGYTIENGAYIAEPEKAFLDSVYLMSRGKRNVDLSSLHKDKFQKERLKEYMRHFPPYAQEKAKLRL